MRTASELARVYSTIREKIEGGMILPGQRLSRRMISQEIGASPAIVAKALAQLEGEGVVISRPRSGTYVRELSEEEFGYLCDVRELIEPYAAACAAELMTSEEIQILKDSCRRYQSLSDDKNVRNHAASVWLHRCQVIREEQIFHGTIIKASGNPILVNLVTTLRLLGQVSPNLVYEDGVDHENSPLVVVCEHEGIIEAIESRNPEVARERMLNHLRGARILIQSETASRIRSDTQFSQKKS